MINNLGYVVLPVENVAEVADWYVAQLDLMVARRTDDSVTLAGPNGFSIELRKGRPLNNPGDMVLGFYTENFDALYGQMDEKGLTFIGGPKMRDGRRTLTVTDCAGYTVELFELAEGGLEEELTIERDDLDKKVD